MERLFDKIGLQFAVLIALPGSITLNVAETITKENISWGLTVGISIITIFAGIALLKFYKLRNEKKKWEIKELKKRLK